MKKLSLLSLVIFFLVGCTSNEDVEIPFDTRFLEYISGFSSGVISRVDNITIELASGIELPETLPENLIEINPSVSGELVKNGQLLVFSPDEPLASNRQYVVHLALKDLTEVPKDLQTFKFAVKTLEQDFDLLIDELRTSDFSKPEIMHLEGEVVTADFENDATVEKMLDVDGKEVEWQHVGGTSHRFTVKGIKRGNSSFELPILVDGQRLDVDREAKRSVNVPSVKEFRILSVKATTGPANYVSVFFSDPIQKNQDLSGLLRLDDESNPRIVIKGNEVQLYLTRPHEGTKLVRVASSIKNSFGYPLSNDQERRVSFDPEAPQVKLIGAGTILPSTDGMIIPFEAVNLKSVRVDIIQIKERNIPQFLQVNNLAGNEQMRRVGKRVMTRTVDLTRKGGDLSLWNRFTLNLASLIKTEKGAIYRVQFSFRPEDSLFPCGEFLAPTPDEMSTPGWSIYDADGFESWGSYAFQYPQAYSWSERENPCHISYYNPSQFVSKNLIASDVGLMAKIGADNSMNVYATNMVTAQPVVAKVRLLDYQLETLGESTTDNQGMVSFRPAARPFLVIAEVDDQTSYLKLDDGGALSMSNFDVSGERIRAGIKGFIYGERGVWRPGDNIFLSFMLEDKDNNIPEDHPVVLEFRDPMNNLQDRQVSTRGLNGLYTFSLKTDEKDPTGNWQAKIAVGNSVFSKTVKVETIKPNRLKVNLDFGQEAIRYDNRSLSGQLRVNWLTGLSAGSIRAETTLTLSDVKTEFEGYGNYTFDDLTKNYSSYLGTIFSGSTSENGQANFSYQLPEARNASGALKATFSTKAFEPGGDFSINTKSIQYKPYASYVGLKLPEGDARGFLQTDRPQRIDAVVLNGEGKKVSRSGVELTLYKLDWRWWWDQSQDYNLNYLSSSNRTPVIQKTFNVNSGKGQVNFQINKPNWGRYLAIIKDPVSGHSSSKTFYIDWPGWADETRDGFGASYLQVSVDKKEYAVADKIEVTIPGSSKGKALVSVENGSRVLESFWIDTKAGKSTFTLDAKPEMAPNIYLHVTLLQPHAATGNDLPIRLYGIVPIKVYDKETILQPKINMEQALTPGKKVDIKVSETSGKPMTYTLAVVDEGLLDITNFETPDPWSHFFKREAIGVKSWDIYDDVIGAYGGRLERLLSIGGGGEEFKDEDKKSDNRFEPVVQFLGPFYLGKGGTNKHSFTMPQYIGSVRTMLIAGHEGAYGQAEQATRVVQPLMVLGTLPRVTGPGEKLSLPVNVFKYREELQNAQVTIKVEGVLKLASGASQSVRLNKATNTLSYNLEVAEEIGKGKVIITAKSGNLTANHTINLENRAPNPPETRTLTQVVEPGQSFNGRLALFGLPGTNEALLEIATVPSINLGKRMEYLLRFPHGCIEQTTSSVFPQLYLSDVMELTRKEQVKIEENVNAGIQRLAKFQTADGGLAYWPGSSDADAWGTSYGYHFLIEASNKGYYVDKALMKQLAKYQDRQAKSWAKKSTNYNDDLIQAYRLFTLALTGNSATSSMNRMMGMSGLSTTSQWRLAAAYALIGRFGVSNQLLQQVDQTPPTYSYRYTYGSPTRDLAMLLETYVMLDNQDAAFQLFRSLAEKLSTDNWMSTQTTAYCLLAASKFLESQAKDASMNARVTYAGSSNDWQTSFPIQQESLSTNVQDPSLTIKNNGKGRLYVTLTTRGTPMPGNESATSSGLDVSVAYRNNNGSTLDVTAIPQGTSFEALVTVTNQNPTGAISDIALSHIVPSGWEIENERLNNDNYETAGFDYQDIRDDRIYTYFDLERGASKTFTVKLTATYAGKYYLPAVVGEAMYDASLVGRTSGKWINVKP